jgi:hypothetical protein
LTAVEFAFAAEIDFAQMKKICGGDAGPKDNAELRYSPAQWMGARKPVISGAIGTFPQDDFARVHQGLRVTPAREAGIAGHVRDLEE